MSLRITDLITQRTVLSDLQDASSRLSQTQLKLASGRQINEPSDDPFGTSQALNLSGELSQIDQYQRNVSEGSSWLGVSDSSMSQINDAVQRARDLVIQGASDAVGTQGRQAAAAEIDQLIESIKQSADATYEGRYVFSGTATTTQPYAVGGSDAYQGDSGAINREIGPGVTVQVNVLGFSLLGSGAGDGKLLDVLRTVSQHLKGGTAPDTNALRTTDLTAIDQGLSTLTQARATVGATTNRLQSASSRLQDVQLSTTKLLSNVQDADMAQTMTDFSMQQAVYQAALKAGANIVQSSLLDFLR